MILTPASFRPPRTADFPPRRSCHPLHVLTTELYTPQSLQALLKCIIHAKRASQPHGCLCMPAMRMRRTMP